MAIADPIDAKNLPTHARRYDLDWLRIIAFGLLIFYHIGMFYVTWGWHVKSAYAGPAAEPLMSMVNPWRLALLFFISGVAIRFASDKATAMGSFAASRALRLGVPILFGMIVVVTPQAYFQLRQAGVIEPGYVTFWGDYLKLEQLFPITTPTWNHLWYVVYLLLYILVIAPVLPFLRQFAEGTGGRWFAAITGNPVRLLLLVIIPFIVYDLVLAPRYPTTHALWGDWANHAHRFTIFMIGYFAAKNDVFWHSVARAFLPSLILAFALCFSGVLMELFEGQLAHSWAARIPFIDQIIDMLDILYAWACIVALLGAAQRWLNRPSRALTYLTGAIFCYYILHQTITIIAGYYLTQLQFGIWPEFLMVTAITIGGCALGYEVLRRLPIISLAFGIKRRSAPASRLTTPAAA